MDLFLHLETVCKYEGDESEPHAQNQLLIDNYNFLPAVLDILFDSKFDHEPAVSVFVLFCFVFVFCFLLLRLIQHYSTIRQA